MKVLYALSIFVTIFSNISGDNIGWNSTFTENNEEFHNLLLSWEKGDQTNVPTWLSGVYIRNGPAQVLDLILDVEEAALIKTFDIKFFLGILSNIYR